MPEGVSELSREIYDMHMIMFWICTVIAIVTFGAMILAMVRFRKSKGAVADQKLLHNARLEAAWTIVPVLILIGMAIPSVEKLVKIEDTSGSGLTVKVTGHQWYWQYEYLGTDVSFYSRLARSSDEARQKGSGIDPRSIEHYLLDVDKPLVIPTGVKVRMLLTANDVIHAWWVPDFGMKRDAIPGLHQRDVDLGGCGQAGHLPRPVRGTVRRRPWLHAGRRRRQAQGRIRRLAREQKRRPPRRSPPRSEADGTRRPPRRPRARPSEGRHALADHDEPQGHRDDVPRVLAADVPDRRHVRVRDPRGAVPAGPAAAEPGRASTR